MGFATDEAREKYGKELKVVENICDHLAVNDAEAHSSPGEANLGTGFTPTPIGVIEFRISDELAALQEDAYRTSAQEHARKFAKTFNEALSVETPEGHLVPLSDKPIANAEGGKVNFDLPRLRKLLSEHPIADKLPDVSERYSVEYMSEKAQLSAQAYVRQTLAERAQAANLAEIVAEQPEMLEQVKAQNPRLGALVEKAVEKLNERNGNEAPAPEQAQASFAARVSAQKEAEAGKSAGI